MIRKSASGAVETEVHTINSIISTETKCYAIDHDENNPKIPLIPTNSIKKQTSQINIAEISEQEEKQDISEQNSNPISNEYIELQPELEDAEGTVEAIAIEEENAEKSEKIFQAEKLDDSKKLDETIETIETEEIDNLEDIPQAEEIEDTEKLEDAEKLDTTNEIDETKNQRDEDVTELKHESNVSFDINNTENINNTESTIKGKNIEDSSISIGEISSVIHNSNTSRKIKAVKEAQNLLASVKVAIDNIKTLAEYEEKEQWFDSVFKDLCTAEWDIARDEVSEIIYKLGKFLLDNNKVEKGKECFWEVYKNFPDTHWYKQVFEELIDLECPKDMVFIPQNPKYIDEIGQEYSIQPYFIDQYPVTNAQYLEFVQATGINPPRHWVGDIYPIGQANHPVVWINIQDAMEYAEWAGKRLPTEIEWSNAAKGKDNFLWPWGNEYESKHCNCREDNKSETTSIGSYFIGRTSSNIYDLAGNVWEWTNSWYDTKNRVLKGGSWFTLEEFTNNNYRNFDYPDTRKGIYGFRCCKSFGY